MKYITLILSALTLTLTACVKEHPDRNAQSLAAEVQAGRAISIKSLDSFYVVNTNSAGGVNPTAVERPILENYFDYGGNYTAQTIGEPEPAGMSLANEVIIEEDVELIHHLNKVKFTTDAPLLKDFVQTVDFLGETNKTYKLKYKLTPNRLVVMKIVSDKEISHYELPYADNLGDGMFAVPLGGYAILPQKKVKILNNDNEATNQYTLVSAYLQFNDDNSIKYGCRTCADYIKIDPESFVKFVRIEDKKDVYPAEYFVGEWYFSESVVDTKPGSETSIGQIYGAFDLSFKPASKIKFFRTSKTLKGYNVAIDEELSTDDTINLTPVISLPADGRNYKVSETGLYAQLQEVEIDDTSLESAPYMDLDFEGVSTLRTRVERATNPLVGFGNTDAGSLKQVKFEKDSFSFTLEDVASGILWKYSFLRAGQRNYQPRRHYKTDREQYGYFYNYKTRIPRPESDYREEDFEKNVLLQRHNPKKDIVFYFSGLTPEDNNGKCRQPGDLSLGDVVVGKDEINFRELGRRAIQYWDAAFEAAGATHGVKLVEVDSDGECFDAPLGDLEYNTINLIDSIQSTNLLGVGPSLIDPHTGEVVNTTTNVHIAPFRQIISSEIRIFIQSKLGTYSDLSNRLDPVIVGNSTVLGDVVNSMLSPFANLANSLPSHLKKFVASQYHFGTFLKDLNVNNLPKHATVNGYGPLDPVNLFTAGEFNADTKAMKTLQMISDHLMAEENLLPGDRVNIGQIQNYKDAYDRAQLVQKYRPTFFRMYLSSEVSSLITMNNITEDIMKKCTEVTDFIDQKLVAAGGRIPRVTSAEETPLIKSCEAKLIPEKMLATIVHELGHNLGLRHNFYGSADKKNFFTSKQEVKGLYNIDIACGTDCDNELPDSSSVMDYVPSDKDRLAYPGYYDIAAIRYGYANAIELESGGKPLTGQVVELNNGAVTADLGPSGSINQNIAANKWDMRSFKYCTDQHASNDIDPMCQRHDYGTTPEESVDDIINQFYESLVISGNRYDRNVAASNAPFSRAYRTQRLKRFYDEWRFKLADYLGAGKEYLENFSPQEYEAFLAQLENDPNFQGKDYLKVRNKIFDFFKDIILLKNKYCLAFDPELQQIKAVELEKIRTQVRHKYPAAVIPNCEDPDGIVKEYIESEKDGLGLTYIADIGFALNNYKYMVDAREAINEPIDVIGTFIDRILTMTELVSRNSGVPGLLQKFNPNMLDEPDLFVEFENMVLNRLLEGVEMSDVLTKPEVADSLAQVAPNLKAPGSNFVLYTNNYEAERPVLLTLWSMLEQGARNPYVNTAGRTTRYGRFIESGSPDLIKEVRDNGGKVLPLDSGEVLVVRKENTVSLKLVNKFYEVAGTLNQGSLPVPEEATLKATVTGGLNPIIAGLPEDSSQMTAEEYLAFADSVMKFAIGTEDPYVVNLSQQILLPELAPYLFVFAELTGQIEQGLANGEDVTNLQNQLNQRLAQVNSAGLAQFFAQLEPAIQQALQNPNFKTNVPNKVSTGSRVSAQMDQAVAFVVEGARLAKLDFESNLDEYIAQATLLRSVLVFDSGISEYIGQILELVALNNNGRTTLALDRIKRLDPVAYEGFLSPQAYVNRTVGSEDLNRLQMVMAKKRLQLQERY